MGYFARKIADSISPAGVRVSTLEATFPRFILAEMNTHRVFSRNSASSRAIPPEKLIEKITLDPFVPETFGKRVKGMGVGEDIDDQDRARSAWEWHRKCSVQAANMLLELDCDKSRINRLLEPHMWHTAIITSTEWENFFGLRAPDGDTWRRDFPAQPEMQIIAIAMRNALWESEPDKLEEGWWHLPMATDTELRLLCDYRTHGSQDQVDSYLNGLRDVCSRRLARVSFDKHTDSEEWDISISKSGELKVGGHFSPFEHIARPLSAGDLKDRALQGKLMVDLETVGTSLDTLTAIPPHKCWSGNLRGFLQYRKLLPYEDNHMEVRNARAAALQG
jgi:thymidylate synthase ThyX